MSIKGMNAEMNTNVAPAPKKHQFSVSEDLQIIQFVNRITKQNINCNSGSSKGSNQLIKWNVIALKLGRSAKQVRERWNGHLNPNINKGPWTRDEDVMIAIKQREFGNKWAEIAKFFPGRTDTMVKNRWNTSVKTRVNELIGSYNMMNQDHNKCYHSYLPSRINQPSYNSAYTNTSVLCDNLTSPYMYSPYSLAGNQIQTKSSVPSSPSPPPPPPKTCPPKISHFQESFEEWLDQIKQQKYCAVSFLDLQEVPPLVQH